MNLQGKTILITGAGRGLGRGIALAVAEAGARVVLTDLEASSVEQTATLIDSTRSLALVADVTDEAAIENAFEQATERFGRLDGLVNNAGILIMGDAVDTSVSDLSRQLAINVEGLFACCRLAARYWIARGEGGAIVNIASNAGKVGYPEMAAYNASKAAVINLTRTLAAEWAEQRINVNAVCPGGVATEMLRQVAQFAGERSGEDPEDVLKRIVPRQLGRHIEPVEVGRVIAFLLSDHAVIIRGQSISVDGGDTPY